MLTSKNALFLQWRQGNLVVIRLSIGSGNTQQKTYHLNARLQMKGDLHVLSFDTMTTIEYASGTGVLEDKHMTTVAEIQNAVQTLPEKDFDTFSSWFDGYEEKRWDSQIDRDQKSGPLQDLMKRAKADFKAGKCGRL